MAARRQPGSPGVTRHGVDKGHEEVGPSGPQADGGGEAVSAVGEKGGLRRRGRLSHFSLLGTSEVAFQFRSPQIQRKCPSRVPFPSEVRTVV